MRAYNFCAGPAALPEAVLRRAQDDLLDWGGLGTSVMEISHRSPEFVQVAQQAEADLRQLLVIPDHYKVLFLQGGATLQFAMVPLNLLTPGTRADYVDTGIWSCKAIAEARKFGDVNVVASSKGQNYVRVPARDKWTTDPDAAYLHYTPNETIGGLEFSDIPETDGVPLVADLSSSILSQEIDISRFGVIYAGAQKNIGPAGIAVVIVREDLMGHARAETPSMLDYATMAKNDSMYNTPPTFAWYLSGLVFQWLLEQGGVAEMAQRSQRKSSKLYAHIDQSDFYSNPIESCHRSRINVPFRLADDGLNDEFIRQSEAAGLLNLKGHRSVGGMRASLYNAVPETAVDALIAFMADFEKRQA